MERVKYWKNIAVDDLTVWHIASLKQQIEQSQAFLADFADQNGRSTCFDADIQYLSTHLLNARCVIDDIACNLSERLQPQD